MLPQAPLPPTLGLTTQNASDKNIDKWLSNLTEISS